MVSASKLKPFPLRKEFKELENWRLRGIFWLSKDLFDDEMSDAIEPDAQNFYVIRNGLEHSYLKVQDNLLGVLTTDKDDLWFDRLAYVVTRDELLAKTIRIFKLARAAMIYLMLGMHREESRRSSGNDKQKSMSMELFLWDDKWKYKI